MKTKPDYKILVEKYIDLWNRKLTDLQLDFEKDKIEFPNDSAICLKWTHLLNQEIWMWIKLCCSEDVEYSQVSLNDFDFIVKRRGFTPRIVNVLRDVLVNIGIGKELNIKG